MIRSDDKRVIDELPRSTAYFEVYPGAILLNQGLEYIIVDLDVAGGVAQASECKVDYYTKSRDHTDVNVLNSLAQFAGHVATTGTKAAAAAARPLDASTGDVAAYGHSNSVADSTMHYGQCTVHVTWYGYRKYDKKTSRITSLHDFELPSYVGVSCVFPLYTS